MVKSAVNYYDRRRDELAQMFTRTALEERELKLLNKCHRLEQLPNSSSNPMIIILVSAIVDKIAEIEMLPFMQVLRANGFSYRSWAVLEADVKNISGKMIECMIANLHVCRDDFLKCWIVKTISITRKVYNASGFAELYDSLESDAMMRWDIGDAIARTKAKGVDDWVRSKLANPDGTDGWHRLTGYAAKKLPTNEAVSLLKPLAEHTPPNVAYALGMCGGADEIPFLEQMLVRHSKRGEGEIRQLIRQAIEKIEKRLSKL